MASSNLFLFSMLLVVIAPKAASDENTDKNQDIDVAVEIEVEPSEESTESTGKNTDEETAEGESAWEENYKRYHVDPNMDGLILLACIVGLVLSIVVLRYMCCTIKQCEERSNKSPGAAERVEHTEKEVILHGVKYKSLV